MTNHTPINQTHEEFRDVLARHLVCALRLYDTKENSTTDLNIYHNLNHSIAERLANAWINCKGDSQESYQRALCYGNLNINYDCNHFNEIAELHYETMVDYWQSIISYVNKSLSGLI